MVVIDLIFLSFGLKGRKEIIFENLAARMLSWFYATIEDYSNIFENYVNSKEMQINFAFQNFACLFALKGRMGSVSVVLSGYRSRIHLSLEYSVFFQVS